MRMKLRISIILKSNEAATHGYVVTITYDGSDINYIYFMRPDRKKDSKSLYERPIR